MCIFIKVNKETNVSKYCRNLTFLNKVHTYYTMDEKFQFQSDTYIQIILKYDNKMEFSKHGKHFFTQAKVSKVLNLDFQFFLYRLFW